MSETEFTELKNDQNSYILKILMLIKIKKSWQGGSR